MSLAALVQVIDLDEILQLVHDLRRPENYRSDGGGSGGAEIQAIYE